MAQELAAPAVIVTLQTKAMETVAASKPSSTTQLLAVEW